MAAFQPFHLAFPVDNLEVVRVFYGTTLACLESRSSDECIDFDFFGRQLVAHLAIKKYGHATSNEVDGYHVLP